MGALARTDDKQVLEKWNGVSSGFAGLLFGSRRASTYEAPEITKRIATHRSVDYTHREMKRTRPRWRFNDERNGPVYKMTSMRKGYTVSSDQGGIPQPITRAESRIPSSSDIRIHPHTIPTSLDARCQSE